MSLKKAILIMFISIFSLNIVSSFACSVSVGFAPEEHKSLTKKYWLTGKARVPSYLKAFKQFKALSGCTLVWEKFKSMHDLKLALISKKVDVGWLKLFNIYIVHKHNPDAAPIITDLSVDAATKKLSPYYNSYILTKSGSGSHGLKQISNVTISNMAFLHPHSASGFIYPAMYLINHHILTVQAAEHPIFINNYDLLYEKLFTRSKIKAIATWDNPIMRDGNQSKIKVIKAFHHLPNPGYVESHPLPKPIIHALTVTFSSFVKARAISPLSAIQGVTKSSDVDYHQAYKLFDQYCAILPMYCNI